MTFKIALRASSFSDAARQLEECGLVARVMMRLNSQFICKVVV